MKDFNDVANVAAIRDVIEAAAVPDGARILNDVHTFLTRFVSYPDEHSIVAHALWICHTHAMDAWDSTPRLTALSEEPESGKTRLLEVTELLVPRPEMALNLSVAYLCRVVADPAGRPTILYDEVDTIFGPKAKEHEDVRGLLNAGHRRGAMSGRCVMIGKKVTLERLPAYCAVALAGIGNLPDTIMTRAIIIWMRRRSPDEKVESFRPRDTEPEGHALRDRLAAWIESVEPRLAAARPALPEGIRDRSADVWEPLIVVADEAGGDWPERARKAATAFVAAAKATPRSLGIRLLKDIRTVFGPARPSMSTEVLLDALRAMEDAPWADLRGKELDSRGLAKMLNKYKVKPQKLRSGERTVRGYRRVDLDDAWKRYLSGVEENVPDDLEHGGTKTLC